MILKWFVIFGILVSLKLCANEMMGEIEVTSEPSVGKKNSNVTNNDDNDDYDVELVKEPPEISTEDVRNNLLNETNTTETESNEHKKNDDGVELIPVILDIYSRGNSSSAPSYPREIEVTSEPLVGKKNSNDTNNDDNDDYDDKLEKEPPEVSTEDVRDNLLNETNTTEMESIKLKKNDDGDESKPYSRVSTYSTPSYSTRWNAPHNTNWTRGNSSSAPTYSKPSYTPTRWHASHNTNWTRGNSNSAPTYPRQNYRPIEWTVPKNTSYTPQTRYGTQEKNLSKNTPNTASFHNIPCQFVFFLAPVFLAFTLLL